MALEVLPLTLLLFPAAQNGLVAAFGLYNQVSRLLYLVFAGDLYDNGPAQQQQCARTHGICRKVGAHEDDLALMRACCLLLLVLALA